MKENMNYTKSNGDIVELSNGAKAICYKWIFKTKKISLSNIERYKTYYIGIY